MDTEHVVAFLTALNCKQIKVKDSGWVVASCPLAPWMHSKHTDHSPSFGVAVNPGGRSHYQCFACSSGSAEELVQTLEMYAKDHLGDYDFKTAHELLDDEPQILPLPEFGEHGQAGQTFEEWPQYWLDSFKKAEWCEEALAYLVLRNVSQETSEKYDLRFDSKRKMIVAPYRDVFGRLAGARGRSIFDNVEGAAKHFDYTWKGRNNAKLVWYNESVLNLSGPVVAVEGQFDCWRTLQAYPKVVAALTAKPSREKMRKLADCPFVIQIPDRDETGKQSVEVYARYCQEFEIGHKVLWLDEGVKDPDECSPAYLKDRIEELL